MKLAIGIFLMLWLISGLAGAWMLEGPEMQPQTVAKGPISLVKGYNSKSPSRPPPLKP